MLQEVGTFSSLAEASVAIAFLQSNDIDASLADAHILSVLAGGMNYNWYRVLVPGEQLLAARDLLAEAEKGAFEGNQEAPT